MSSQIQITGETKVKSLTGVLVGTTGVVSSLAFDVAGGVPKLDVNGKILVAQLPNSVMEYQGTWNATTNVPYLVNGVGNAGDVWLVSTGGVHDFGAGAITFVVSDQVIFSNVAEGSIWQKASGSNGTVTSVAITETGDSLNITGSPITTSGTINIGFNGTNLQYVNGAGNLTTFPILTGYVTAVSGTAPVVSSGGTTPAISMAAATGLVDGYLLATDFAIFNAKQSALTFSSPLVNTSGTISIPAATTSVNGYLASADFTTFNNKQNAITLTTTGTSGVSTLVGATLNIPNYGSALTGYVPYTGATQDVNLGAFLLTASGVDSVGYTARGSGTLSGYLILKQGTTFLGNVVGYNSINANSTKYTFISDVDGTNYKSASFELGSLTNNTARTYTLPNANGTLALTSDLANYVDLTTAQTISGVKTFSTYPLLDAGILIKHTGILTASGYTGITATTTGLVLSLGAGGGGSLIFQSTSYSYTFPAATGTIALVGGSGVGTVTSVAALTIGTSGTDLSSTVATSTTTPVITLNVPTASAANRGALSSADWSTFNSKQGTITLTTTGTSGAATFSSNTLNIPNYGSALSAYLPLTGGTLTGALSGTSASFSGTGSFLTSLSSTYDFTIRNSGTGNTRILLGNATSAARVTISCGATASEFARFGPEGNFPLYLQTNGTDRLTIDGSGAATFSSNITSNGNTISLVNASGSADYVADRLNISSGATYQYKTNGTLKWYTGLRGLANNSFYIFNNATSTNTLILDESSNAATFSSSVTATNYIVSNTAGAIFAASGATAAIYGYINNTSGRFYFGSESSTGGAITTGSTAYYGQIAAQGLQISANTGGNVHMTITPTGNVGIGTTNPSVKLDVIGTVRSYASSGNYGQISNGSFLAVGDHGGTFMIDVDNTGAADLVNVKKSGSSRFYIKNDGNVGIGTSTPDELLTLSANVPVLKLTSTNASGKSYQFFSNSDGNFYLRNATTSTNLMVVTNSNNVLIGTTTDSGYKLDVNGTGRFSSNLQAQSLTINTADQVLQMNGYNGALTQFISNAGYSSAYNGLQITSNSNNANSLSAWSIDLGGYDSNFSNNDQFNLGRKASGGSFIKFLTIANTGAATFSSSVTATSFFESSDSRLKTLIQDNYQTKGIASITPKLYTKNGKVELGYYAQDFVGILDSAVSKGEDDMLSLSYREVLVAKVYALEQRIKELENK